VSSQQPILDQAIACLRTGDFPGAAALCRQLLACDASDARATLVLGYALQGQGNMAAAIECFERLVSGNRTWIEPRVALARVLRQQGNVAWGREQLRELVQRSPQSADAWHAAGEFEAELGEWLQALNCYAQACQLNPAHAAAAGRLAVALHATGQVREAADQYATAAQLNPESVELLYNWGTALSALGQVQEARRLFAACVQRDPMHVGARINLGAICQESGEWSDALEHYERAIQLDPQAADAHYNRGLIRLLHGDLSGGWQDFEWRDRVPDFPMRQPNLPRWDGTPSVDKTLLVHAEQGLGDTLQFVRYLNRVRARCPRLILQVQARLVPLLRQSGFPEAIGDDVALPPADWHVPLMSLPRIFGTTWESIPHEVPYLFPQADHVTRQRAWLRQFPGYRVGIAWRGSPTHRGDAQRSVELCQFEALSRVPGVTLVSLQRHDELEQRGRVSFAVQQPEEPWDMSGAFVDTAALVAELDLVITVDTAIAHLAGALGRPVWLALSNHPDWRWQLSGDGTPWYPTMRLFRQTAPGDWAGVMARMAQTLAQAVASTR